MDVFTEERQRKILEIFDVEGRVSVPDLTKRFQVSEVTIRRDLKELAKNYEYIQRTYGGAILAKPKVYKIWHGSAADSDNSINITAKNRSVSSSLDYNLQFKARSLESNDNQSRIAEVAYGLIQNTDKIILESSSINIMLAKNIQKDSKITVFTNCPTITSILGSDNSNIEIYCSGGLFDKENNSFTGMNVVNFFNDIFVDKAFINIDALNKEKFVTVSSLEKSEIKKSIIRSSKEIIALCDSACLNSTLLFNVCNIEFANILITDKNADKSILEELKKTHLEIYLA